MKKFCMRLAYTSLLTALIPSCTLICASPIFAQEATPTPILSQASAEDVRFRDLQHGIDGLKKELVLKDARLKQVTKTMNLLKRESSSKDKRLQEFARVIKTLKQEIRSKETQLQAVSKEIETLKEQLASKGVQVQELGQGVSILKQENAAKDTRLQELTQRMDALDQRTAPLGLAAGGAGVLGGIAAIGYVLLRRRAKRLEDKLIAQSEKRVELESSLLNELEKESNMLESISSSVINLTDAIKQTPSGEPSSDFIELLTTVANRLAFMEVTLYRMDPNTKGHRQLVRSLNQIRSNLLANDFEVVEMLGKPYSEGMRVIATFVDDEKLEQGSQVISGITKPQINYKGKTIQAAQITVSQNI